MSDFKIGDRVEVKPEYDELRKMPIPGYRTQPGVVTAIHGGSIVMAEDNEDGPGGGSSAPYKAFELRLVGE